MRAVARQAAALAALDSWTPNRNGRHGPSLEPEGFTLVAWHSDSPTTAWAPDSWRSRPAAQQPVWPDEGELKRVHAQLARSPAPGVRR